MDANDVLPIILVGFGSSPPGGAVEEALIRAGVEVRRADDLDSVRGCLEQLPDATLVVFATSPIAAEALDAARRTMHGTPVIVVVEHADFSEYYDFMERGVVGYFESSEPPSMISSAAVQAQRCAGAF